MNLSVLLLHGAISSPTTARAVDLVYETPAGTETCPKAQALKDAVSARLGYEPWHEGADQLFKARVEQKGDRFLGRIQLVARSSKSKDTVRGARTLGPVDSCDALINAMALAISIVIDPLSRGQAPKEPKTPPPPKAEPKPTPFALSASGGVLITGLSAPKVTAGFQLGVFARFPTDYGALSVGVEGRGDIPATLKVEGGELSTSLLLSNLIGCVHYERFAGCLSASLGALRADAEELIAAKKTTSFYSTINARGQIELPLGDRFAVAGHIELSAVLTRFQLIDERTDEPFWTTPVLHGHIGVRGIVNFY